MILQNLMRVSSLPASLNAGLLNSIMPAIVYDSCLSFRIVCCFTLSYFVLAIILRDFTSLQNFALFVRNSFALFSQQSRHVLMEKRQTVALNVIKTLSLR